MSNSKNCDECRFGKRLYADGYILKNWKKFDGMVEDLPLEPDQSKFWTYLECAKNSKKLKFINLDGKCQAYQKK